VLWVRSPPLRPKIPPNWHNLAQLCRLAWPAWCLLALLRRNQSKMPLLPRCPARLFQPKPGHASLAQEGGRAWAVAAAKPTTIFTKLTAPLRRTQLYNGFSL
jgi:hypothetical protein